MHRSRRHTQLSRQLRIEPLEDRRLLAVYTVSNLGNAGPGSLRDAINQANATAGADEIDFTVTGAINIESQLPTIIDDLQITGPGKDLLTIDAGNGDDGNFGTQDGFRIFEINDGDPDHNIIVALSDVRLTGGDTTSPSSAGGAILNRETLSLVDMELVHNAALLYGGAIYSNGILTVSQSTISHNQVLREGGGAYIIGEFTLKESSITNNFAGSDGGGIYNTGNTAIIDSSILRNESGKFFDGRGGGIYSGYFLLIDGSLSVTRSYVAGNSATFQGGGIFIELSHSLSVIDSTISENSGSAAGGGIYQSSNLPAVVNNSEISGNSANFGAGIFSSGSTLHISDSTMSNNVAYHGGALFGKGNRETAILRSTISGNQATLGGGIHNESQLLSVSESLLSENVATERGGAIYTSRETLVRNSTISSNSADEGGGIYGYDPFFGFLGHISVRHSTISGNTANTIGGGVFSFRTLMSVDHSIIAGNLSDEGFDNIVSTGNTTGPEGNFNILGVGVQVGGANDQFTDNPRLGPLAFNGGPTKTHALLPGSPAIDAGDPSVVFDPNAFDQRGAPFARLATGVILGIPSEQIDIGAYEAQAPPSADFVDDDIINGADFLAWQRGFSLTSSATRADGNSDDDTDVDHSDLAAWLVTFGQTEELPPPGLDVSAGKSLSADRANLIDAAMAIIWSNRGDDAKDETEVAFEKPHAEALTFALAVNLGAPDGLDSENKADDSATAKADELVSWHSEELQERDFSWPSLM